MSPRYGDFSRFLKVSQDFSCRRNRNRNRNRNDKKAEERVLKVQESITYKILDGLYTQEGNKLEFKKKKIT
jgi:hypothetical protein